MGPLGSSRTSQTWRGYLYAATRSRANARSSAGGGGRAGLELHGGADFLAEIGMRDSDHGDLSDGLVLVQDLLDLARVHVVPAADDQVLLRGPR